MQEEEKNNEINYSNCSHHRLIFWFTFKVLKNYVPQRNWHLEIIYVARIYTTRYYNEIAQKIYSNAVLWEK